MFLKKSFSSSVVCGVLELCVHDSQAPTVQSGIFRHVRGSRTNEYLAEWLKSRRESGGNMPILRFWYFGHLFQFLGLILVLRCSCRTGNCDSINEIDLI